MKLGGGCSQKFALRELRDYHLRKLVPTDPRVVISPADFDDVGAYQLEQDTILVQSLDVIAPLQMAPRDFGAVCAAHCMSDVLAKGVKPLTAMNILFVSYSPYDPHEIDEILAGLREKLNEAGAGFVGGHTLNSNRLFCGLAITGVARSRELYRKIGARPGDRLVLTKPLGVGILNLAVREGRLNAFSKDTLAVMKALNSQLVSDTEAAGVHAATDVTGGGLASALADIATAGKVKLRVDVEALPVFDEARDLLATFSEDGAFYNECYVRHVMWYSGDVPDEYRNLLVDPQTSGGLLVAIDRDEVGRFLDENAETSVSELRVIGEVTGSGAPAVEVW